MRWTQDLLDPHRWTASLDGSTLSAAPMPLGTDWRWKARDGRTAWLAFGAARTLEDAQRAAEEALEARLAESFALRKA